MEEAEQTQPETQATESTQPEQTSGGLFETVSLDDSVETEQTEQTEQPEPDLEASWYWADGVKGQGERPEWLKERYKNVSEQAKAYTELEKKFGEFKGAPKDGYSFENISGMDPESPVLKGMAETLKDLNLSQQGFERLVTEFINVQQSAIQENAEKELAKLGPQAKSMVQETVRWVNNNLSKETAATIQNWIMSAQDYNALKELQSLIPTNHRSPTSEQMAYGATYETSEEVRNEKTQNWSRYNTDVNYRKSIDERFDRAFRREKAAKK